MGRRDRIVTGALGFAAVEVAVELVEPAARDLDPNTVPGLEAMARHTGGNGKFVNPMGLQYHLVLERFTVARADDAFGDVYGRAIGRHIAELDGEIRIHRRTGSVP